MSTQAGKTQENKGHSAPNNHTQKQASPKTTSQLVDQRSAAAEYSEIQQMADNSPQAMQFKALQEMADRSPQAMQFKALQAMADRSPQANQMAQLQAMADNKGNALQKKSATPQGGNKTGLPNDLKSGIENLSGYAMDDVNVHRNSDKPAQLNAHAYAQGTDIHLAPGQEKHLPHEAWHVAQQKQGRVQPTVQKKGVSINDDDNLEREADVMGAKALSASGAKSEEEGVMQQKEISSKSIQMKGDEIPDTFMGLEVIGYGYGSIGVDPLIGDGIVRRYLLKGKEADWRNLLSKADGYHFFNNYVLPFLSEAMGKASGSLKYSSPSKTVNWQYELTGNIGEPDILEFLKALYDTNDSTKSAVDLPNSMWEADANVMSYVDATWEGLADFIGMYQHLIIHEVSKNGKIIDKADVKNLAEQGHTTGQAIANTPYVVEAMVHNAVATAVNSVKSIIKAEKVSGDRREKDVEKTININMVINSAILASSVITQYGSSVSNLNKGAEKAFDSIWGFIPFAGKITSAVAESIKVRLKGHFLNIINIGGDYKNPAKLKEELANKFHESLNEISKPEEEGQYYMDPDRLAGLINIFRTNITSNV